MSMAFVKVGNEWVSVPHGSVTGQGSLPEYFGEIDSLLLIDKLVSRIEEGPGAGKDSSFELEDMMKEEEQEQRQWQFRGFYPVGDHVYEDKVLSLIWPESDPQEQFSAFSSNLRRKIRKAAKNGIAVSEGREELLDDFYEVYSRNCHRMGSPFLARIFTKDC